MLSTCRSPSSCVEHRSKISTACTAELAKDARYSFLVPTCKGPNYRDQYHEARIVMLYMSCSPRRIWSVGRDKGSMPKGTDDGCSSMHNAASSLGEMMNARGLRRWISKYRNFMGYFHCRFAKLGSDNNSGLLWYNGVFIIAGWADMQLVMGIWSKLQLICRVTVT